MLIEISYSLTADDLQEFQRGYARIAKAMPRVKKPRGRMAMVGWVTILVAAVVLFTLFHNDPSAAAPVLAPTPQKENYFSAFLMNAFPYCLLFLFIWIFLIRGRFSKAAARRVLEENEHMADPQRVVLEETGVTIETQTSTTVMKWTHFPHFSETQNLFLLMVSQQSAQLIPKRAFASPAEINEFRGFAQAHIGNATIGFPVLPPNSKPGTPG